MESKSEEDKKWEEVLRRMLPAGSPLPDQDQLDYSIAVEYQGPPISFHIPKIEPIDFESQSFQTSSFASVFDSDSTIPVVPIVSKFSGFYRNRNSEITRNSDRNSEITRNSSSMFPEEGYVEFEGKDSDSCDEREKEMVLISDQNSISVKKSVQKKRAVTVTFNVSEEAEVGDVESLQSSGADMVGSPVGPLNQVNVVKKKGVCHRCGEGNRLKEREACFVCDARYCSNCLLKAMGSMPEGRKCLSCIGQLIMEPRRARLGKTSRLLGRVCSPLEVQQIMKAEKECPANQLRAEQVVVNGRQLRQEELAEILGCAVPLQKLKPGKYWYDKDSGLWGKEGEKPNRIITSKLNVGGKLRRDASKGNTKVYINGREITNLELKVLKLAKVQCPRDTHFWVYEDGSYEEEGQNNIKGNIWGKASTRLLCSVLSLPVPPAKPHGKIEGNVSSTRMISQHLERGRIQKLMLLGSEGSGTSTIFKQAKFMYGSKFTEEELQSIKIMIQNNLYNYLSVLLEGRERFDEEALMENRTADPNDQNVDQDATAPEENDKSIYSINQRLKHFSEWLLEIMASGDLDAFFPAREYAPVVNEIWKDPAIHETYKRRDELSYLPDVSKYFLDKAIEISSNEYEPSEQDILYAEGITQSNGLAFMEFSFDDRSPMSEIYNENLDNPPPPLTKYQLIRVNSKGLLDGCKWIEMFEDAKAVLFCIALSEYDQKSLSTTGSYTNKMLASRDLFESIARHPCFRRTPFLLLLNKYDVFEEKIKRVPLAACDWFEDFSPVRPHHHNNSLAHQAYYYIAMKFKDLYSSINSKKLFVWQTRARDRTSVDEAFKYAREVLKWDEEKDENMYGIGMDESFYDTETSSSPYFRQG